jgi:TrmH family RNA methyltransferase
VDPLLITSVQNPRVKQAARLRDNRQRAQQGRFLIDGVREVERALAARIELAEVYVCRPLCDPAARSLVERIPPSVARFELTEPVFAKLAFGERAEGIVAVALAPERSLERLALPEGALVGVLAGVEKPGNVGAVFRSADAAGLDALIVADAGTDLWNPNCIRASLGTVFAVPAATAASEETLSWLTERGLQIVAARVDATVPYTDVDFRRPTAIVLGSEAHGLSAAWNSPAVTGVRLPMRGLADSLNVSATAAVLFYEALRQRAS